MKTKKAKLEIWNMEEEYGIERDSIGQALEYIVEAGIWGNDKKADYPRHWLILENGKLIKTVRVDSIGRVSWTTHSKGICL